MALFKKYVIIFVLAIILGGNLFARSDKPPYGYPSNELSDNYWGIIVDIAHRWRSLDFSLWNRGLGGGMCLFVSGQYPILNPTNALAWVMNDEQFYLVKLIEPYVFGFFFMAILLWDIFKTRWYIAVFGGFSYMGMALSKSTAMAQSPYFLYGIALFPAMVYCALKLSSRHVYLMAAGVGALLTLQFLAEGVTQTPQMLIWWSLFFLVYLFFNKGSEGGKGKSYVLILKQYATSIFWLFFATFGLCAIQMIPSQYFFLFDSARQAGHYTINNFSIFKQIPGHQSLWDTVYWGIITVGPVRSKVFLVIILMCLALSIRHFGRIFRHVPYKSFFYLIWLTTFVFFMIPPTASLIAAWLPFTERLFSPLTYIGFRYGLHTLDFCIVLSVCLILNNEHLKFWGVSGNGLQKVLSSIFFILAFFVGILPMILFYTDDAAQWVEKYPILKEFVPSYKNGIKVLIKSVVLLAILSFRPRYKITHIVLTIFLFGIGFMMLLDCYKWYGKGSRAQIDLYQWESPEHQYFRKNTRGKYVHLYNPNEPAWMKHNYNLIYGAHGTSGFMAVSPMRLTQFFFYHAQRHKKGFESLPYQGGPKYFVGGRHPPEAFASYFPIDIMVADKGSNVSWLQFKKIVSGEQYDIYEREKGTDRVYFANKVQSKDFFQLLKEYDRPRSSTVYITREDAHEWLMPDMVVNGDPSLAKYSQFRQEREDRLSFKIETNDELFVTVPERFIKGWTVKIDGKEVSTFPAYHLFIGFKAPKGVHEVEMKYVPPYYGWGIIVNLLCIAVIVFLFKKFYDVKH